MSKIDDGGPAFPTFKYAPPFLADEDSKEVLVTHHGMTLRDWFAGQALVAFAANHPAETYEYVATEAYCYADAMLKVRKVSSE